MFNKWPSEFRKLPIEEKKELLAWRYHKSQMTDFEHRESEVRAKEKARANKAKSSRKRY